MKQSLTSSEIPFAAVSNSSANYSLRALRASERFQSVSPPYSAVVIFYNNTLASISTNRNCTFKKEEPEIKFLAPLFLFRIWSVVQVHRLWLCRYDWAGSQRSECTSRYVLVQPPLKYLALTSCILKSFALEVIAIWPFLSGILFCIFSFFDASL